MALGASSEASAGCAIAIGSDDGEDGFNGALPTGEDAIAVGTDTAATGTGAIAEGLSALCAGATTTKDDQVTLGGAGSSVRIGDIDASTDAQVGPVDVVTVDANGTLGRQAVATASSVDNIRVSVDALAQVSEAQFGALESTVAALDGRLTGLEFQLQDMDDALTGGIAAAAALGSAIAMPDKDFVLAGNLATYSGQQGYALTFVGRASENFALTAGVAGNTGDGDLIAQAGFAFGF